MNTVAKCRMTRGLEDFKKTKKKKNRPFMLLNKVA